MPAPTKADPYLVAGEHPADRLLRSQAVREGSLHGDGPPTPLQVAAVLHGLADHTALMHIVNVIVKQAALADPDDKFWPEATSLGRYFHRLGDHIEFGRDLTRDTVAREIGDLRRQLADAHDEIARLRASRDSD